MLSKGYKTRYNFANFKTIRSFGDAIRNGIFKIDMPFVEQKQWAKKIREFVTNTRPRNANKKKEKESVQNSQLASLKGGELIFNAFRSGVFLMPSKKSEKESDDLFPP